MTTPFEILELVYRV